MPRPALPCTAVAYDSVTLSPCGPWTDAVAIRHGIGPERPPNASAIGQKERPAGALPRPIADVNVPDPPPTSSGDESALCHAALSPSALLRPLNSVPVGVRGLAGPSATESRLMGRALVAVWGMPDALRTHEGGPSPPQIRPFPPPSALRNTTARCLRGGPSQGPPVLAWGHDGGLHGQQLHLKGQHGVGRDGATPVGAIAPLGLDEDAGRLANGHSEHSRIPALDDGLRPDLEREGLPSVAAGVELGPVRQGAHVMHRHLLPHLGEVLAIALDEGLHATYLAKSSEVNEATYWRRWNWNTPSPTAYAASGCARDPPPEPVPAAGGAASGAELEASGAETTAKSSAFASGAFMRSPAAACRDCDGRAAGKGLGGGLRLQAVGEAGGGGAVGQGVAVLRGPRPGPAGVGNHSHSDEDRCGA
eukprot:CAMPEP_0174302392 /NCGR_PEP_ID=MMETSP0809-20121228/59602_1 /TAXON_ID=73025 ORGANISM="Eutreptiella gymnastica-like, Strain CCMP1594" /NCGR_SAMPLE_ID=MMETSP0809 /ASSEMBLY_ACC=CAM_ASM_000658 /LENGTH=419 /DNA_ID=CAMNT_0015408297 /DNA_START=814 /DNA_END=2075 /DNA_ORIENTATION=-